MFEINWAAINKSDQMSVSCLERINEASSNMNYLACTKTVGKQKTDCESETMNAADKT